MVRHLPGQQYSRFELMINCIMHESLSLRCLRIEIDTELEVLVVSPQPLSGGVDISTKPEATEDLVLILAPPSRFR